MYLSEIKHTLGDEPGLSEENKDVVMAALERLAKRLRDAETSRDAAVSELDKVRHSYRVRLTEPFMTLMKAALTQPYTFRSTWRRT